jgi:hypothetical protein
MDKDEARLVALQQLNRYRARTHAELQKIVGEPEGFDAAGPSGKIYAVEIDAVWDDSREGGDLRVMAMVDDGGSRVFTFPVTEDFIMRPDGTFVGEG